jgi:hypothetical protein
MALGNSPSYKRSDGARLAKPNLHTNGRVKRRFVRNVRRGQVLSSQTWSTPDSRRVELKPHAKGTS